MSFDQFLLSADTTDLNYPEIRPTLDLNFARVKALDPRITFTRASGGTYVGADGLIKYAGVNEARFDHDPETGESLGLLIEEARTNLFTDSEIKSPETWGGAGSFGFDNIVNPYGVNGPVYYAFQNPDTGVGEKVRPLNANGLINITVSFFAKRRIGGLNRDYVRIQFWQELISGGSLPLYNFKFDGNNPSTTRYQNIKTEKYSNEWYKFSFNPIARTDFNDGVFGANARFDIEADNSSGADNYVWGIQVEAGSFPTSYIPTQASTRTRATESVAITGKKFSDFYNQSEGTIFSTTKSILPTGNNGIIWSMDNTSTDTEERTELFRVSTNYRVRMRPSSGIDTIFTNIVFSDQDLNNFNNCIVSYKRDDSTTFSNAISTFIVSRGEIPILNRLLFSSSGPQVKWISVFRYWPKRIPNIQIRLLTSN
jgi:hypothetical protein